ncbi:MAG TPA: tRNA epoxyqueuosine(34) reductase QueG [Candidatus Binataceae bacterium]|nr:tRNA epoxyqueuosine(34) reductase QueG [Candidatus Binataceae bacterium]
MTGLEDEIAAAARAQGFVLVGFTALRQLARENFYLRWLGQGRHGEMAYLARDPGRRFDPRRLDPRLRSVISLGFPYQAPAPGRIEWRRELRGRIASYALGEDYHDRVIAKAEVVAASLEHLRPGALARVYVDTGPVFEREWAREASLGWFGKNTNLLNRNHGSYFFLAEIFTDLELGGASLPYGEFCGTCRRCLDLCPTGALQDGYVMESRRCISYLTIELRGPIAPQLRQRLDNWIFGCDICQEVCPWNEEGRTQASELEPYLPELLLLDEEGFRTRFGKSAIKRAKRRGLLRNVAVALGNTGNPDAVPVLAESIRREHEPLVRAHVAWALGQLGGGAARRALHDAAGAESEPTVAAEIDAALGTRTP